MSSSYVDNHVSRSTKNNTNIQTCSSLFVATPQYVSSKYASDFCGFDKTSHACKFKALKKKLEAKYSTLPDAKTHLNFINRPLHALCSATNLQLNIYNSIHSPYH